MIIQHNLSAEMATHANGRNVAGLKLSTERLSTGYQINRAADNASGLSVTEKMRSQIRGLSKATNNANDAISLIQTAEGALNETENILQRMRELSVQSANGTYTDDDRMQIQHEVDSLKGEIDRISQATEFNEMKLLNGEVRNTLQAKGKFNEYGALYGSINRDLAIGGGKITIASEIHDVSLRFTTGASGKGGENAVYSYEYDRTGGDLTQTVTINLVKGQYYSDDQIQKLIDNAKVPKEFEAAAGKIYFSSSHGVIKGAEANTYSLITGNSSVQKMSVSANSIADAKPLADSGVTYRTVDAPPITQTFTIVTDPNIPNREYTISGDTITVGASNRMSKNVATNLLNYVLDVLRTDASQKNTDSFGNYYKDEYGNKVNGGYSAITSMYGGAILKNGSYYTLDSNNKVTITRATQQRDATIPRQTSYDFTITADKPGSYNEYVVDDELYKTSDTKGLYNMKALSGLTLTTSDSVSDNVSLSVDASDKAIVTLKKGYAATGAEIAVQIENLLRNQGYEYSVSSFQNSTVFEPDTSSLDNSIIKNFVNTNTIFIGSGSSTATVDNSGRRALTRVGTVAGVRQELSGDLTSLMIRTGSGTLDSSDHIKLIANSYGAAKDYDSIIGTVKISTTPELIPGAERVDIDDELATIHLATGTEYTNHDIERLLKNAGLDYTVELTDKHDPDGDYDGIIYFNTTGEITVSQTQAGEGLGIEDISKIRNQLEFQIGANGVEDQKVGMDLIDASARSLGVDSVDVSTQEGANRAIELIDDAIKKISTFRADMGALQNRMEHSVNSLNVANENLTAAESQIRDTDMAAEMVKYTRNNILQQASQSMLAQANHQSDGILSMLQ